MTSLNYSHTLVAGAPENVNDVQDMFNDVKTLVNGNLDATNAPGLVSQYGTVMQGAATIAAGNTGTRLPRLDGQTVASGSASGQGQMLWPVAAADWTVTGLTTKLRLRALTLTGDTAPGITLTYGLYPISSMASSGPSSTLITVGTVVSGSTVARATPAANSNFTDTTSDFTLPADGVYVPGVLLSGATAASSLVACVWQLQVRHV